jgi:cyclic beta-1,2-glucan synthetase
LAHPLNRPVVRDGRVVRGFGIIQPFPCASTESAAGLGWMAPLVEPLCNEASLPSFVRSLHFDLFSQCSFHGKGIYEVAAFHQMIAGKLPDEQVLSHDTLEGGLITTGYAGDILAVETAPGSLRQYYYRIHRWIRGDWQSILPIVFRSFQLSLAPLTYYMLWHFARRSLLLCLRPVVFVVCAMSDAHIAVRVLTAYWLTALLADYVYFGTIWLGYVYSGQILYRSRYVLRSLVSAHKREILFVGLALHQALVAIDALSRAVYRLYRGRMLLDWQSGSSLARNVPTRTAIDLYAFISVSLACVLCIAASLVGTASRFGLVIPIVWITSTSVYWKKT